MVDFRQGNVLSAQPAAVSVSYFPILVILALAAALRIYEMNTSLWYDEIDTLVRYVRMPFVEIVSSYDSLNNHLFFSLQAKVSVLLFGEAPWALRLPAVILGVASVWALWWLAREVVNEEQALLAALLMAVSYHHVWFSQNARGYTGLLFFALLATRCLVRGLRSQDRSPWVGFAIWFALSMYTHLSSALLFAAMGLAWVVILGARRLTTGDVRAADVWRPLLVGGALGLVLTFLLYLPVLGQMAGTIDEVQRGPADVDAVASIAHWANPFWMIQEVAMSLGPLLAPLAPVVLVVVILGMAVLMRRAAIVPLTFIVHVPLSIAVLVMLSFRVWPRYFFADIGFICLFLILGAYVIGGWVERRWRLNPGVVGRSLAVLGIAASLVLLPRNYASPKQDFIGARDYVTAEAGADATVMVLGLSSMPFTDYYAPDWVGFKDGEALEEAVAANPNTWIVYTFPSVMERRYPEIFASLEGRFEKAKYFPGTLSDGGIVVLRPVAK